MQKSYGLASTPLLLAMACWLGVSVFQRESKPMSKMILVYSTSWLGEVQRYWFRKLGKPTNIFLSWA